MARVPKSLAIQAVSTTSLTTLNYIVPTDNVTTATLILTNTTSSIIDVTIFINNTVSDFIIDRVKIPAGSGKRKRITTIADEKLNAGFQIKVQSTTADTFNAFLSGSEVNVS